MSCDVFKWHSRFNRIERAVFLGSTKFIVSTAGKRELYDLSKDRNEKSNLYRADENASKELEAKLNEWLQAVRVDTDTPVKMDKKTINSLKSLGYIK